MYILSFSFASLICYYQLFPLKPTKLYLPSLSSGKWCNSFKIKSSLFSIITLVVFFVFSYSYYFVWHLSILLTSIGKYYYTLYLPKGLSDITGIFISSCYGPSILLISCLLLFVLYHYGAYHKVYNFSIYPTTPILF